MAAGDTYQLAIIGICNGQKIVNTHHFRAEAGGDLSSAIATDWDTNLKTSFLALLPPTYSIQQYKCVQINPEGPVGVEQAPTGTVTGGVGTVAGGLNVAQVLKWTTGFVGRSRRGRTFIGPMAIERVSGGTLIAGQVTNGATYITNMLARYGAGGAFEATARLVIWSPTLAAASSQNPPPAMGSALSASAYVLAGVSIAQAKSQRRRDIGVGE